MRKVISLLFATVFFFSGCNSPLLSEQAATNVATATVDRLGDKIDATVNKTTDKTLDYIKSLKLEDLSGKLGSNLEVSKDTIAKLGTLADSLRENSQGIQSTLQEFKRISVAIQPEDIANLLHEVDLLLTQMSQIGTNV